MNNLYKTLSAILLSIGFFLPLAAQNIDATLRQKFVSSIGATNDDQLGSALVVEGDVAVIGANYDDQGGTDRGAIYVLGKDVGGFNNWGVIKKIINGAGTNTGNQSFINVGSANGDYFGLSVSISGNIIAVGAPVDDQGATNRGGAVYILGKDVGGTDNWGLIKKIINGAGTNTANQTFIDINSGNFEFFGFSVSILGNTLAVGSRYDDQGGSDRGAAYLFGKDTGGGDNWGLIKKVVNGAGSNTGTLTFINVGSNNSDNFGFSTSLSGTTLAIGVPSDNQTGMGSTGAVYLLGKDEGGTDTWGLLKKIINGAGTNTTNQSFTNITTNSFDFFGAAISLSGNTLLVGARFDDQGGSDRGAVYIINKDAGGFNNWGVTKKVINGTGTATSTLTFINIGSNTSDSFGYSVSISGDLAAIGAFSDDQGGSNRGAAYILSKDKGGFENWGLLKKIINGPGTSTTNKAFINSGSHDNDLFGIVSLSGTTLAVGAFFDDQAGTNRGAAYLFTLDPSSCSLTASITPDSPQTVCPGASFSLSGSSTGGVAPAYNWSSVPAGFSSSDQNPTFIAPNPGSATTYMLTLTVTEGSCIETATIPVTVTVPGPLTISSPITSGTVVYNGSQITATNQISNANVEYIATQSVTLNPGFSVTGNTFKAYIGGCN